MQNPSAVRGGEFQTRTPDARVQELCFPARPGTTRSSRCVSEHRWVSQRAGIMEGEEGTGWGWGGGGDHTLTSVKTRKQASRQDLMNINQINKINHKTHGRTSSPPGSVRLANQHQSEAFLAECLHRNKENIHSSADKQLERPGDHQQRGPTNIPSGLAVTLAHSNHRPTAVAPRRALTDAELNCEAGKLAPAQQPPDCFVCLFAFSPSAKTTNCNRVGTVTQRCNPAAVAADLSERSGLDSSSLWWNEEKGEREGGGA